MKPRYFIVGSILLLGVLGTAVYTSYPSQASSAGPHSKLRPAEASEGYGPYSSGSHGPSSSAGTMGRQSTIARPAFVGYYDGHHVTYLNTDVSSRAQAAALHINYSAALAFVRGAPAIYFVNGRAAGGQLAVFGSQPGEPDYSPLWQETSVTWRAGVKAVLLTSDNQVAALARQGKLTIHANGVVLNCPIIKVGK